MKQLAALIMVLMAFSCIQVDYAGTTDFYIENQTASDLYFPSYYHLDGYEQEQYLSKDIKEIEYIRVKAGEKIFIRQDAAIGGCPPAEYSFHKIQLYRIINPQSGLELVYEQDPVDNNKWDYKSTGEWSSDSILKIDEKKLIPLESSN